MELLPLQQSMVGEAKILWKGWRSGYNDYALEYTDFVKYPSMEIFVLPYLPKVITIPQSCGIDLKDKATYVFGMYNVLVKLTLSFPIIAQASTTYSTW
ncbi:hypothetical protein ANCCAN_01023 [Ancylostoma caninum]|uniref:Uncharacterized protein n=1 Tax=Ancylostoma caninum TaxID=29170 RepID=A0A368HBE1_ANCCA|nr:hypothetical protein ANCCAN_01023 [Ancylostoma caninum]